MHADDAGLVNMQCTLQGNGVCGNARTSGPTTVAFSVRAKQASHSAVAEKVSSSHTKLKVFGRVTDTVRMLIRVPHTKVAQLPELFAKRPKFGRIVSKSELHLLMGNYCVIAMS